MNPDQCLEMMNALRDAYKRVALSTALPKKELYHLKHILTEIELAIISMKKSMKIIESKLNTTKKIPPLKEIPISL